jgi:hypothetical protein
MPRKCGGRAPSRHPKDAPMHLIDAELQVTQFLLR